MIWFSSDFHLFHKNVIRFDNRPFKNINEMHETIVHNWNDVVQDDDTVYYLGDLTFGSINKTKEIIYTLKGKIIWIKGHHDKEKVINKLKDRFESVHNYLELREKGIVLFHYPILSWNGIHRGSTLLHGHCHQNLNPIFNSKGQEIKQKRIDVGCMGHNYYPINLDRVHEIVNKISNVPIDHHEEK